MPKVCYKKLPILVSVYYRRVGRGLAKVAFNLQKGNKLYRKQQLYHHPGQSLTL